MHAAICQVNERSQVGNTFPERFPAMRGKRWRACKCLRTSGKCRIIGIEPVEMIGNDIARRTLISAAYKEA